MRSPASHRQRPHRQALLRWAWSLTFIPTYVLFDWVSYIDPFHQLNISPWNLAPALGLLFIMEKGAGGVFTLASAMLFADIVVRSPTAGLVTVVVLNLVMAFSYMVLANAMSSIFKEQGIFTNRSALMTWIVAVVTGTYVTSMISVFAHAAAGLLPPGAWTEPLLQLWLGDGVGILVTLPLLWHLRNKLACSRFLNTILTTETLGYTGLGFLALWIAFQIGTESSFRYFYALFLPAVWAATRQGACGAIFSVAALQLGMVVAGQLQTSPEISLIEIQMRILVLALVAFFIGVTVDEQARAAARLRETMRLVTAGEMAGAIAHELNQPLTALSAYSSACRLLVSKNQTAKLTEVVEQIIAEANRASNIVRRLRELFGSGTTSLSRFPVAELLSSVTSYFQKSIAASEIVLEVAAPIPQRIVYGDRVQLEILIRNLLANARDAIHEGTGQQGQAGQPGLIRLAAFIARDGSLRIRVTDNGPGISRSAADSIFDPFFSTKSSGLGLGLSICREIAAAHGGTLELVPGDHTCFELTLPTDTPH